MSKLDFLDTHTEHEFLTIEDKLDNLEGKLENVKPDEDHVAGVVHKVNN